MSDRRGAGAQVAVHELTPCLPHNNQHEEGGVVADTLRANGSQEPSTLAEAHEMLRRQRPKLADGPLVWVAFHRRCAEVYAEVAKVDLAHRHEAQYWAGEEIRRAREIEEKGATGDA